MGVGGIECFEGKLGEADVERGAECCDGRDEPERFAVVDGQFDGERQPGCVVYFERWGILAELVDKYVEFR